VINRGVKCETEIGMRLLLHEIAAEQSDFKTETVLHENFGNCFTNGPLVILFFYIWIQIEMVLMRNFGTCFTVGPFDVLRNGLSTEFSVGPPGLISKRGAKNFRNRSTDGPSKMV